MAMSSYPREVPRLTVCCRRSLLGWFAFEVGGVLKGIGAAIHPHHPGRLRSLCAPGVRHKGWNDDSVVRTNDTALIAELHPDPAFKHHDGFFHVVQVRALTISVYARI